MKAVKALDIISTFGLSHNMWQIAEKDGGCGINFFLKNIIGIDRICRYNRPLADSIGDSACMFLLDFHQPHEWSPFDDKLEDAEEIISGYIDDRTFVTVHKLS